MKKFCPTTILLLGVLSTQIFLFTRDVRTKTNGFVPIATPDGSYNIYLPVILNNLPVYYVSPEGSDENPGTFNQPWKTIGKAAQLAGPGDTVFIREGIYTEYVSFRTSGAEAKPIKILAYPGETPIVDGRNQLPLSYTGLVSVHGDWIQVSGLEVRNSKYTGLGLYGKHDIAKNIYAHHSQKSGIYISGDFGIVENSRVWRNSIQNEFAGGSSWSSGLVAGRDSTDGLTEYAIMRDNIVWENWGQGIDSYEANGTIIQDNISHDNYVTNIYISDSTNILCQRNFVFTNPDSYVFEFGDHVGIMIGDELYTPPSANITVINNVSYGNNWNFALWKGLQSGAIHNLLIANNTFVNGISSGGVVIRGYHQNVRFENNLVQQDGPLPVIEIGLNPELSFSNNLWSKPPIEAGFGPGDVIGDPVLVQVGLPYSPDWFRLTDLSPAIGNAQTLPEIITDYFGNPRDSAPDIGAVEYIP